MRVLVACEFSGIVRDAFLARGHEALSCDLKPSERPGPHYQGDVLDLLGEPWDLLIAHPPCTNISNCSAKWLYHGGRKENGPDPERWMGLGAGAMFFRTLLHAPVPRICVENPIMLGYAKQLIGTRQTQVIQPWQHGHGETKATCLWLKNLPELTPTQVVAGRRPRVHHMSPGPDRGDERSRTYPGIAAAMASQWG